MATKQDDDTLSQELIDSYYVIDEYESAKAQLHETSMPVIGDGKKGETVLNSLKHQLSRMNTDLNPIVKLHKEGTIIIDESLKEELRQLQVKVNELTSDQNEVKLKVQSNKSEIQSNKSQIQLIANKAQSNKDKIESLEKEVLKFQRIKEDLSKELSVQIANQIQQNADKLVAPHSNTDVQQVALEALPSEQENGNLLNSGAINHKPKEELPSEQENGNLLNSGAINHKPKEKSPLLLRRRAFSLNYDSRYRSTDSSRRNSAIITNDESILTEKGTP